jgi:small ubiquitin-related modifier
LFVTPVVEDEEGRTITRTMRRSDRLKDLTDFYYAMVPTVPRGEGAFLFRGKRVEGGRTPADCEMEDGDRVHFFLAMKPSAFIAVTLQDLKGHRFTRTMRRTDAVRDVMDFYYAMVPAAGESHFVDSRTGKRADGKQTPADLEMEDGDVFDVIPEIPHTPRKNGPNM